MSKFSLRRVLALGATVALGSTLIAGLPANAADPIQTAGFANLTYTGTGTKVVEGTDFDLTLSGTNNTAYECYSVLSAPVTFTEQTGTGTCATAGTAATSGTRTDSTGITNIIKWRSSSADVSVTNDSITGTTVSADSITADTTATITAYLDVDATPGWSSGDVRGPEVTLTFVNYVEADWVMTLEATPVVGTQNANLKATLTPAGTGWNKTQMDDDVIFQLYRFGLEVPNVTNDVSTQYDETLLSGTRTPSGLGVTWDAFPSATYTVRAFIGASSAGTGLGAVSAAASVQYQYSDAKVAAITIDDQATANITTGDVVRSGTKEIVVTATVRDQYESPVAKAGQKVQFVVSSSVEMTFNGKTVKAADGLVTISATTDASGSAKLTVGNASAKATENFTVSATIFADHLAGDFASANAVYTWRDAYPYGFQEAHEVGSGVISSVRGQSYTLTWTVTDQFGQLWKESNLVVQMAALTQGGGPFGLPAALLPIPVVNGKASYTVPEALKAGEVYYVVGNLLMAAPGSGPTSFVPVIDYNSSVPSPQETGSMVVVIDNATVGNLDAKVDYWDESGASDVSYYDFETNNFLLNNNTLFEGIELDENDSAYISGTVTNSNGVVIPGATVKVSGAGLFWTLNSNASIGFMFGAPSDLGDWPEHYDGQFDAPEHWGTYSENSITVQADENGYYEVWFSSHKSGKNTVTATAGGKSASVVVDVDTPSADNADDIKVSAPKSVKAGRSFTANVNVVDMWGNTVASNDYDSQQLSAFSNRGLLVVGNPVEDEKATFQVKVLLQPLDRGPVLVNLNWLDDSGMDNITASKSFAVWAGPAATAKAGAKKGRVIVEAYRAVGKTVNVFVGKTKVASFVPNQANDRFVVKGIKSGSRKVSVKIASGYDYLWQRDGRISVK